MRKPNINHWDPSPTYIRQLVKRTGFTQAQCAEMIGISVRAMRRHLRNTDGFDHAPAPYPVQYALENLAGGRL